MLETYDPDWMAKSDRAHAMMRALEVREHELSQDERHQLFKLRKLLPVIFDAKHRTADQYVRFHLALPYAEANRLGIKVDIPQLPPDAGIDDAREAVRHVFEQLGAAKRRLSYPD